MTRNDAYKYARRLRRAAWHFGRGPFAAGFDAVEAAMKADGHTEADYALVRAWLKAWQAGRRHPAGWV